MELVPRLSKVVAPSVDPVSNSKVELIGKVVPTQETASEKVNDIFIELPAL